MTKQEKASAAANDALESGIVFPNLMLRDLLKICQPELGAGFSFEYYKRVLPLSPTSLDAPGRFESDLAGFEKVIIS